MLDTSKRLYNLVLQTSEFTNFSNYPVLAGGIGLEPILFFNRINLLCVPIIWTS